MEELFYLAYDIGEPESLSLWVGNKLIAEIERLQNQLAEINQWRDVNSVMWDNVNDLYLCHQCQPLLENAMNGEEDEE